MPLYSDSNFYYTSGGGTGGSPYYTPGLYGSSSSASSSYAPYTATYSRSMTGSYVVPLSTPRSPTYTSSALSSRYQPKLSTITESPLIGSSRHTTLMPLTRIQSPKYSSYTTPTTTTAPKYIPARPININTADIDVSSSRYHHTFKRYQPSTEEEQKKESTQTSPKSSINAEHRDTTAEKNDTTAAGEGGRQARTTIKRNRAVVRLSTVRSRSKDRNKVNETAAEPDEKRFRDLPRPPEENLSWRQKLAQDLAAIPTYPLKKTPGELLRERYLIQEAKDDELSTPGARHISHLDTATNVMEEPATIDKVVVELDPVDHTIRRLSIPNCPTFHDICEDISSDKIDDDLNAGVLRRRASLIQEQEQELFNQLQESASETFQMLPLERNSNSQESSTDESSSKAKHPSKKTKKRHKITAIVEVENTPLITVEEEIDTPKHIQETSKPKFSFNVESVEEHHELHKILKLPKKKSVRKSLKTKKKSAATLPEGFVPAIPKPQSSPKAKDDKPKTFITTAEIFTFSQQSVEESKAEELQKEQSIDEPDISVALESPTKMVKQNNVLEETKPKLVKQEAVVVELLQQASSTDPKASIEVSENVALTKPKPDTEETLTSVISKPNELEQITTTTSLSNDPKDTTSSLNLKDSHTTVNVKDSQKSAATPKLKDSEKTPTTPKANDSEKTPPTSKLKDSEKSPTTPKVKDFEKTVNTPKAKVSEKTPTLTLKEPLLQSNKLDIDVALEPKPYEPEKTTTPILKTSISIELSSPTEIGAAKSVATPTISKPPLIKSKAIQDSKDKQTASPSKTNAKQIGLKSAVSLDTPTSAKTPTKILEKTQSLNNEDPKIAAPKLIEKKIQKSESGEDFWSQIGTRESIYMTNRKNNLLGSQWSKQEDLSELPGENDDVNDNSANTVAITTAIDKTLSTAKLQNTDTKTECSKQELKLTTTKSNKKVEAAPSKVKSPTQKTETSEALIESKTAEIGTKASSTPIATKKATTTTTKAAEQSKPTTPTITTTTKASVEKAPAAATTTTTATTTATTTTTKISSGQEAKSPEQQQATNSTTTTAAAKIKSNNNNEQPISPSAPAAAKTCEAKQTTELATPTVATKSPDATIAAKTTTAKTTTELSKQPLNAAAGTKQTETKTPKLTEAKKKLQTDPKSTDTTSNKKTSNTCTLDATAANKTKATGGVDKKTAAKKTSPTAANKTSPTINADHFVTIAPPKTSTATSPTKNKNASPTTKPTNVAAKQKTQQQQPVQASPTKVNDSPLNTKATVASTATTTVGATTTTAATSTTTAVSTATATAATGTENVLAKFATVSNLAQCLQDVDGDLDDYIPSSAENSDDDSSYDYSSPDGCENLSASMKKKLKQRRKKEKQAAEPARFDPQKKVKITIDATTKCFTKEQAPRYPLVATPRPLWKREQNNYNGDSDDSDSDASGSTEETTEDSDEYTSSSEYEDDLRPTGGANSDASATSGNKENSAIIRLSTCSNDSGFEGGTAPSSPKKMLGARELRESPSTPPSLNPAYKIEPNEEHDETSYTYSQFQKSGRFTAPATVIPRFKNYTVDDFHFLAVLGKGSFGKVLLAELRDTTYYYAVKCLKKDVVLEDDDVDSTLIERKVLALGTKHPYLCHLFCTFQTESHLFFVMEYLNGGDLMFHIQESGRFTEERARFYGAEIISGLKFLHKKGIIYRDLKLDNVLLDYEGHVRIADFGMCKLQIYLDKTADSFCGTPDYMAPEIIKGEKYNQNVDWWSFGVLLYEMLIGQSPFSGCDEDELFWSICNEVPWFPVYITEEATSILKGLLEKDYTKRVGSQYSPAGDIAEHVFFQPIDWNLLDKRQLEPPFRPQVKHPLDTQYFDRVFTRERVRLTPIDKEILQSMDQKQFHGFTYTNPHITLD